MSLINSFNKSKRVNFSYYDIVNKAIKTALLDFVGISVEVEHLPYMYETLKLSLVHREALEEDQRFYYDSWMISHTAYPVKPSVNELMKYKENIDKEGPKKSNIFG